ncbi:MAG: hypothetical protein JJU29_18230 [Verrucomicrobia bacterium]|nr:hypothetical protein [Verrucomicrobiota bacterium]MCH8514006.1 SprT-like domain-containing protein [Kiritimatiellia bacterium]
MSRSSKFPFETPRLYRWWMDMLVKHGSAVDITVTENRRSMIRVSKKNGGQVTLRLHHGFESAPDALFKDLEAVLSGNRATAWTRVAAFARTIPAEGPHVPQPVRVRTRGKHVDLQPILDEVNRTFFQGEIEARITWGQKRPQRRRGRKSTTVQFGVWDVTRKMIRIHPGLDDTRVPSEFLRYLVYHELCHAARPPRRDTDGRNRIHHQDFKTLEARYPDLDRMERLSKEMFRLLRDK